MTLEARDEAFLADDQRHPVGGPALERLAVARPLERDHRVVAVLRATILDGRQCRVLVAQLFDDLVDPCVVDDLDLGLEVEVLVVAELDLRADLDRRLEDDRLALLGLDDLDVRVRQRQDRLVDQCLAVGIVDQVLDGLVQDDAGPERALEHRPRSLAGAKAGDARTAREPPDGVIDGAAQTLRRELDLEDERAVGRGGGGDLHCPGSIGRERCRGRWAWSRVSLLAARRESATAGATASRLAAAPSQCSLGEQHRPGRRR